jgi:hypothetical protein
MMRALMTMLGLASLISPPAFAERLHVVGDLQGYKCVMLNIAATQAMDPNFHEPVYSQPSAQAPVVGYAGLQVAIPDPPQVVNGFEQALFANGAAVWIRASDLKAYRSLGDPTARCVPVRLSNGRLGFSYPHD